MQCQGKFGGISIGEIFKPNFIFTIQFRNNHIPLVQIKVTFVIFRCSFFQKACRDAQNFIGEFYKSAVHLYHLVPFHLNFKSILCLIVFSQINSDAVMLCYRIFFISLSPSSLNQFSHNRHSILIISPHPALKSAVTLFAFFLRQ